MTNPTPPSAVVHEPSLDWIAANSPRDIALALGAQGSPAAPTLAAIDRVEREIMSNLALAAQAAAKLVEASDLLDIPAARVRARRVLAQTHAYANRFDLASTVLDQAIELGDRHQLPIDTARARLTSVHILARQGKLDQALAVGERARAVFVEAALPIQAAMADCNLATVRRMMDDPAAAVAHFERAVPALAAHPQLLAQAQSNRAEALLDLNRFEGAHEAFTRALDAFRAAGAPRAAAIVEGNLADLAARQGRFALAVGLFESARRAIGETDAPGDWARLTVEHADALLAMGLASGAYAAFEQAAPVLAQHNMTFEGARAQLGLGLALEALGQGDDALPHWRSAAHLFAKINHNTGRARVLIGQARLASSRGDTDLAQQLLAHAAQLLKDRPAELAQVDLERATLCLNTRQLQAALTHAQAALHTADQLALPTLSAALHLVRSKALLALGQTQAACEDAALAMDQLGRVRGSLPPDRHRSAFLSGHAPAFDHAAAAFLDLDANQQGPAFAAAFAAIERGRARSLLDLLDSRHQDHPQAQQGGGGQGQVTTLIDQLTHARGELRALYARLEDLRAAPASATKDSLDAWKHDVHDREHAIDAIELRLASTSDSSILRARSASLAEIRQGLVPGSALVEYFAEGDHLSAFVITPSGLAAHRRFALRASVQHILDKLAFQIERSLLRGCPTATTLPPAPLAPSHPLALLHQLLWAPLAPSLAGAAVIAVAPAPGLHAVPFAALWDGHAHLIRHARIINVPSGSVLTRLGTTPRSAGPLVVIGVADQHAPHAEDEATEIARACRIDDPLIGQAATIDAVIARLKGAGHVHIASHARVDERAPLASAIRLADGWLTARDLLDVRLSGAGVVLSACDTGKPSPESGSEMHGFIRALLVCGARSLITAIWPVHDQSARSLMVDTYFRLYNQDEKVGIGEALALAQRALADGGVPVAGWAPFLVTEGL